MAGKHKTSTAVLMVSFVCGLCLGIGVAFGGMTDARKSSSFFNLTNIGTEFWDPSLAIMFAAAVASHTVLFYIMRNVMQKPLLAPSFSIPSRKDTPLELFVGSAMFGAGWALGGYCPGPAIVAAWEGHPNTLAFVGAMIAGMGVYKLQRTIAAASAKTADDKHHKAHPALHTAVLSVAAAATIATTLALYYRASTSGHSAQVARNTFYLHPWRPAFGGAMIGTAVALMMALCGEILGISGIVSGLFSTETQDKSFRLAFVMGLLAAGAAMWRSNPDMLLNRMHRPLAFFLAGGFMVGFGTGLGSGCTSGHGVAGLTRLSIRSIIAVGMFMLANFAVTTALQVVGIGTGWQHAMQV